MLSSTSIIVVGHKTIQDSWFPGYAWQITYCGICHSHLGWLFSNTTIDEQSNSDVRQFWGIVRESCLEVDINEAISYVYNNIDDDNDNDSNHDDSNDDGNFVDIDDIDTSDFD